MIVNYDRNMFMAEVTAYYGIRTLRILNVLMVHGFRDNEHENEINENILIHLF